MYFFWYAMKILNWNIQVRWHRWFEDIGFLLLGWTFVHVVPWFDRLQSSKVFFLLKSENIKGNHKNICDVSRISVIFQGIRMVSSPPTHWKVTFIHMCYLHFNPSFHPFSKSFYQKLGCDMLWYQQRVKWDINKEVNAGEISHSLAF